MSVGAFTTFRHQCLIIGVERLHVRSQHPLHSSNAPIQILDSYVSRLTSPAGDSSVPSAMFIHGGQEEQSTESVQVGLSAPLVTPMTTPMPNGTAASNSSPSPCLTPARLVTVTPLQPVSPATMVTPDKEKTYMHVSIFTSFEQQHGSRMIRRNILFSICFVLFFKFSLRNIS